MLTMVRKVLVAGFGTAACLVVVGCGGAASDSGDAVVVTEPNANVPTTAAPSAAAAAPSAAPAAAAPAAAPTTSAAAPAPTSTAPAAAAKSGGWGTLKGQVVFGSNGAPQEVLFAKGQAPKDPTVCAKDDPILSERLVVDAASKGVKNVLVFLTKPTAVNDEAKAAAAKTMIEFDQKNCVFKPHVLAVMAGSKIELKSSDPVNHNVNAKFKSNSQFNSLLAAGQQLPYTPASPERQPAQVTCDIHPWMLAYWMVLDHPYFAVTDANGNFEIKNVPSGAQKVVVWQEAAGYVTPVQGEEVSIAAGEPTTKSFTVDPGKIKK
ncbi:MAG: carboxypeptidase regulatory-like domain-containing protein [Isosphaeraceae bacterium]